MTFDKWKSDCLAYGWPETIESAFNAHDDEIAKLRKQREWVLNMVKNSMEFTEKDMPLNAMGCLEKIIESESASPDAGKDEICKKCGGIPHIRKYVNQRDTCRECNGTGKRTEGK